MARTTIPEEIRQKVEKIIDEFNKKNFKQYNNEVAYYAEYKGKFLYLQMAH